MAKKKNAQVQVSQAENEQAQEIFGRYQQIAAVVRASEDQPAVEIALGEINALSESVQMALLKRLATEQQVDAADLLAALYEFATLKTVRKEARRALIRLEGAKVYPRWQPPAEPAPGLGISTALQLSANPPRFWKGFVTDSRASGEVQLTLAWQQGEDYKEARVLTFLLEFWRDGVKDFMTQLESKRSFENLMNQVRMQLADVKLKDCSLAHGRRLVREALEVNTKHGTKPHRDYQLHVSLVKQLLLEAPGIEDEEDEDEESEESKFKLVGNDPFWEMDDDDYDDEDEDDEEDLHGLEPIQVASRFVDDWVDSNYERAYQLLAQDSSLREGLSSEEWIQRRRSWSQRHNPADLRPGLLAEREAPKSKLWLPNAFSKQSTSAEKEVEISWSVELEQIPLVDEEKLPEILTPLRVYAETGRHWFWASFTLVQEGEEWRIQSITDEGARARELSIEALEKHVDEQDKRARKLVGRISPKELEKMDPIQQQREVLYALQALMRKMCYMDALLTRKPQDHKLVDDLTDYTLRLGDNELGIVYMEHVLAQFPEEKARTLREIGRFQQRRSRELLEQEDDESSEHFMELAEKTLLDSLTIEDHFDTHIELAEVYLAGEERMDDAEKHLLQAQKLTTKPDDGAHIEMHLGEIAMEREEYQEALKHFQRRAELDPTNAEAWFAIGEAHEDLGNAEEAETNYRRAIELDPTDVTSYAALSTFYQSRKQPELAIQALEEGIQANPDSAELRVYSAILSGEMGDDRRAIQLLKEAEKLDPENGLVRMASMVFEQSMLTDAKSKPKKPQSKSTSLLPEGLTMAKKKGHQHH